MNIQNTVAANLRDKIIFRWDIQQVAAYTENCITKIV